MDDRAALKTPEQTRRELFEDQLRRLRKLFDQQPNLQDKIIAGTDGLLVSLQPEAQVADKSALSSVRSLREVGSSGKTPEESLSEIYLPGNYERMVAKPFTERAGVAGVGCTNESFYPERMKPPNSLDGYLIGTGNGAIWTMLELFPEATDPKAVISLDIDPSVILSGKVVVEMAKRGISREEAVAYLYGDYSRPSGGRPGEFYIHKVEEVIDLAREIALREQNLQFRQALLDALEKGEFVKDVKFMRERHDMDHNKPLYESGSGPLEIKGRINTAAMLYKHWDQIVRLAKSGRIFFGYSNIKNEQTLDFITQQLSDITTSNNLIYTSNVVDYRYAADVNELERFNRNGQSIYVSTTQRQDNYVLKITTEPPVRSSRY